MGKLIKWVLTAVAVVSIGISTKAQAPVYHPGDVLKVTVTFAGPDADKLSGATADISIPDALGNQAGFSRSLYTGDSTPAGDRSFTISFKIPQNQATGDYKIDQIRAISKADPTVIVIYTAPKDFTDDTLYRIENPGHFVSPTISDIK